MERWRHCRDCDVAWASTDETDCWSCGRTVEVSHTSRPRITSREVGRALSDGEWSEIRRREGVA